jgi:hypothetical protein
MLGMNRWRAIVGGRLCAKEPEVPVERAEVRVRVRKHGGSPADQVAQAR